jgi:hypothetical protein
MTELAQDREAVLAALAAHATEEDERVAREAGERSALEKRRQALSPEALAGDKAAVAELEQVEAQLAALDRREQLRELAETEQADRDRAAAEAETERQRQAWQAEKKKVEDARDAQLGKIEKAIGVLVDLIPQAIDLDSEAERLGRAIDPRFRGGGARKAIEWRLSKRLREVGMADLGFIVGPTMGSEPLGVVGPTMGSEPLGVVGPTMGSEPLGAAAPSCSVCVSEHRPDIDEALAAGESLRALEERFGVSRSVLSRHRREH